MSHNLSFDEVKLKLENWCVYQERCIFDCKIKISSFNLPEKEEVLILKHLQDINLVNERRFVEAIISGKKSIKKWGKNKIIFFLKSKQIALSKYIDLLQSIEDDVYNDNLLKLINSKWSLLSDKYNFYKKKQHLYNFLINKGYTYSQIDEKFNIFIKKNNKNA